MHCELEPDSQYFVFKTGRNNPEGSDVAGVLHMLSNAWACIVIADPDDAKRIAG